MPTPQGPNHRYPIWSAKAIALAALLATALIAILALAIGHESLFKKVETTLGLIAAALYLFLAVGLYGGIRVRKEKLDTDGIHIPRPGGDTMLNVGSAGLDFASVDAANAIAQ